MAKDKLRRRSGVLRVLERKIWQETKESLSRAPSLLHAPRLRAAVQDEATDPTGSCRYADGLGQMQCESPVAKSYCDGKGGFFTPGGRC